MADTIQTPLDQGPTLWDVGAQADPSTPASEATAQFRARADAARDAFLAIACDPDAGVAAGLSAAQALSEQLRKLGGALVLQLDESRDLDAAADLAAGIASAGQDANAAPETPRADVGVAASPAAEDAAATPAAAGDAPFALLDQREIPWAHHPANPSATPFGAEEPVSGAANADAAPPGSPAEELTGPLMSREAMLARFRQTRQTPADAAPASASSASAKSPSA